MAIAGFDKHQFGHRLNEVLFASQPIQSIEHLFGRQQELDRIEKALFAAGRHILFTVIAGWVNHLWRLPLRINTKAPTRNTLILGVVQTRR